jgi:hypothetical protein
MDARLILVQEPEEAARSVLEQEEEPVAARPQFGNGTIEAVRRIETLLNAAAASL